MIQEQADLSFVSQQLCIVEDNSPELGRFFADPGHATSVGGPAQVNTCILSLVNTFILILIDLS